MVKNFITAVIVAVICSVSYANILQAPPAFDVSSGRGYKAVFIDFLTAHHSIQYDLRTKKAKVESVIKFRVEQTGMPLFDLVPMARNVRLDGKSISTKEVSSPDRVAQYIMIEKVLGPGEYTLELDNYIESYVTFNNFSGEIRSAFWMSDLSNRQYLEQFLPTNMEFDQYEITLEVKLLGTSKEHTLYTNGDLVQIDRNHWKASYPSHFTASSLFYHLLPQGDIPETSFEYSSIDGRKIPVTIYSRFLLNEYKEQTLEILAELEQDFGPWPHKALVVYGAGSGGMEYCGATITSLSALGHELTHSYFARGIMPARGNAGWVDEAIASWRDEGYPARSFQDIERTQMAGHSVYRRTTDMDAYDAGERFIGYLDSKFTAQGGMKQFLRDFKNKRLFRPFLTSEFQSDLEEYFKTDLEQLFQQYIYGSNNYFNYLTQGILTKENPNHPRRSEAELNRLL